MNILNSLRTLLHRRNAAFCKRRRMCSALAGHVAVLERRALLAAVTDAGDALNIELSEKEEFSLSTDGTAYHFVSDSADITDNGTTEAAAFSGFGTMELTLNDLSKYTSINITANGQQSRVRFADSGSNTYVHDIDINLPDFLGHVDFSGETNFGDANLTTNLSRNLFFEENTIVTTHNGEIDVTAWFVKAWPNVTLTTTGTGNLSFFGTDGVSLENATTSSTATGVNAGTVSLLSTGYQIRTGHLSSVDGDISVDGHSQYGGNVTGVLVNTIESTGTGQHAANISVMGQASQRHSTGLSGVTLGTVTSIDGDVSVTGIGSSTGEDNHGVSNGRVSATGSGSIVLDGTTETGTGVRGIEVSTVDGNIEVIGTYNGRDDALFSTIGVEGVAASSTNGTLTVRGQTSDFGGHGISVSKALSAPQIELHSDTILLPPNRLGSAGDEDYRINSGLLTVAAQSTTTGDLTIATGAGMEFQTGIANSDFDAKLTTDGNVILEVGAILNVDAQPFWVPVAGAELMLVERAGGSGTFQGLTEGAVLSDFFNATISYVGGDGNDIVLTLPQQLPTANSQNVDLGEILHSVTRVSGVKHAHITGLSVLGAGDVNNDGFDDFLVATAASNDTYLVFGKPDLPTSLSLLDDVDEVDPEFVTIGFGRSGIDDLKDSIAAVDINNDGYSDIVMRETGISNIGSQNQLLSRVVVIYGSASLPDEIFVNNVESEGVRVSYLGDNDLFGTAVSAIGDINNDGFQDIAIGAPASDSVGSTREDAGSVYVVFGGDSLPETLDIANAGDAAITIFGAQEGDALGSAISGLGDINGDGIDDFIIGAPNADGPGDSKANAGESYVLFGGTSFWDDIDLAVAGSADIVIHGADAGDSSGWSVGGGGDVNGDERNDILIGAPFARGLQNAAAATGETYLIRGSADLPGTINLATPSAETTVMYGVNRGDHSGHAVDIVGDLNQDGIDDIAIGAWGADSAVESSVENVGLLHILLGRNSWNAAMNFGIRGTVDVNVVGENPFVNPGHAFDGAGDVDGDGQPDLLISGGPLSAEAYFISGSRLFSEGGKSFITGTVGENPHQPTIQWTFAANSESYELWVGLIGGTNNPVINETSSRLSYDTAANDMTLGIGRYRAWVRTTSTSGVKSEWTNELFSVTTRPELHEVPEFDGTNRRPTITWDAVPGALRYRLFVTNTTTNERGLIDVEVEGTSYQLETELEFGEHRVWVQPIGVGDFKGQWSYRREYTVRPLALEQYEAVLEDLPELKWAAVPGVATYRVAVFDSVGLIEQVDGLTGASHVVSAIEGREFGGTLFWHVTGITADGSEVGYEHWNYINISGRTSILHDHFNPVPSVRTLTWPAVPTAESYEVYARSRSAPYTIFRQADIADTTFRLPPMQQGNFDVWVRATLPDGVAKWGNLVLVYGEGLTPYYSPNVTQLPVQSVIGEQVTLKWNAVSYADTYDVYVLHNNRSLNQGNQPERLVREISGTEVTLDDLPEGSWKWWVRPAIDGNSPGEWSGPRNFSTNGRVSEIEVSFNATNVPTFQWSSINGATGYVIQVNNRTTGEARVIFEDTLTSASFTAVSALATGEYRMWVRAISSGSNSPWSAPHNFSVN